LKIKFPTCKYLNSTFQAYENGLFYHNWDSFPTRYLSMISLNCGAICNFRPLKICSSFNKMPSNRSKRCNEDVDSEQEAVWSMLDESGIHSKSRNISHKKKESTPLSREMKLIKMREFLLKNESKFESEVKSFSKSVKNKSTLTSHADHEHSSKTPYNPGIKKNANSKFYEDIFPANSANVTDLDINHKLNFTNCSVDYNRCYQSFSNPRASSKQFGLNSYAFRSFSNAAYNNIQSMPLPSRGSQPSFRANSPRFLEYQLSSRMKSTNFGSHNAKVDAEIAQLSQVRRWVDVDLNPSKTAVSLSVMSYNVLSQNLLEQHPYLYRDSSKQTLEWNFRWQGLKREVMETCPDILCLQEVQFSSPDHYKLHFVPYFDSMGYKSVIKTRTGKKSDGCAIFYNSHKFALEEVNSIEYKIDRVPLLDRDNVGLVCKLVPTLNPSTPFVVGTTHLLYNPKRQDIRLCQTAMFLAEMDRMARSDDGSYLPMIVTGDLNSDPSSPLVELLCSGKVHYQGRNSGSRPMPQKLLPDSLGLGDTCQWQVELEQRGVGYQFITGTGGFTHNLGLASAYPLEGEVTTFQNKWTMVDYLMFNPSKLKLVSRLALPSSQHMRHLFRLPSFSCPSDHLPLLSKFQIIDS